MKPICLPGWRCGRSDCDRCGAELRRRERIVQRVDELMRKYKPREPDDPRLN